VIPPAALAPLAAAMLWGALDVTARPADTACPPRPALASALAGRVPAAAAAWTVRYRVEAPAGDAAANHVWLELRDDRGDLRLRRELAIPGDGCEAAADALASIVARYFREVSWTGAVPLPDMQRAPDPAPPRRPPDSPWEAQAGAAARRELDLAPGLSLDLRRRVASSFVGGAGLVLHAPVTETVGAVEARLWSLPVRASLRATVERGRWTGEVGPQLTASAERGVTSGAAGGAAARLVLSAGAVGSARLRLSPEWTLALEVAAEVTLVDQPFSVGGLAQPVLTPRRIQTLGVLGLAWPLSF
jgi:hypothetical protein